ncbi:unnamed protein product [Symbiodinium sp. CCMP2592]|nr:unnamed protein product [Symbiodinium sp. CCMP2592]
MLEAMRQERLVAVHAFNATMSAFEKCHRWPAAIQLYGDINRYELQPDVVTCNALLSAYDRGGHWPYAVAFLDEMVQGQMANDRLQPNVVTYSTVISGCERGRAWQQALKVFSESSGIKGDTVIFNAALSACDRGSLWLKALDILAEMHKAGLRRNLATYGSLISACGNALQWQASLHFLQQLQTTKLEPGGIVLNLCINACRKAEQLHAALGIFKEMLKRSEEPDVFCYTSMISACGPSALWQLATYLHQEQLSSASDIASFNATIGVCREASRWQEAQRIFSDLCQKNYLPTLPTYKAVIGACAYAQLWAHALEHLRELKQMQDAPCSDVIIQYGIVSKASAEAGRNDIEQMLLNEAWGLSVPLHISSFVCEWLSVLHWETALSFFEMQAVDVRAPLQTLEMIVTIVDVLLAAGRHPDAWSVLLAAHEDGVLNLWEDPWTLDLHQLGPCSAAVAVAAVSAMLLSRASFHRFCARDHLVIITGQGLHSLHGVPRLLPAVLSLCDTLGLKASQDRFNPGRLFVPAATLHALWQGVQSDPFATGVHELSTSAQKFIQLRFCCGFRARRFGELLPERPNWDHQNGCKGWLCHAIVAQRESAHSPELVSPTTQVLTS